MDKHSIDAVWREIENANAARKEREIELLERISARLELIESDSCEARLRASENVVQKSARTSNLPAEKIDPQINEQPALRKANVLKQISGQLLSIQKIVEEIQTI